jgi:membrane-associated phospholipid phosphatase
MKHGVELDQPGSWREEVTRLDVAVYAAIAATPTPILDEVMRRVSRAADYSRLWLGCAGLMAVGGGATGRRAAARGLASTAVTSALVNLVLKPLGRRRRPDRETHDVSIARHVRMPSSTSFPSGHAASAFSFAAGVATTSPEGGIPLYGAASVVAYSRVHTGVHYPLDVIVGAVTGVAMAPLAARVVERRRP